MNEEDKIFMFPGFVSPMNKIISLSLRRSNQWSLSSRDQSKKIGEDKRNDNLLVDDLNIALAFFICALVESVFEGFLLDYINGQSWENNDMYELVCDEIITISSPYKLAKKYKDFYGKELKYGLAIKAVFEMRNLHIHSSAYASRMSELPWMGNDSRCPKFFIWLVDRFGFKKTDEFNFASVVSCNFVFNQLLVDVVEDLISLQENKEKYVRSLYPVAQLREWLDGWMKVYCDRCGGCISRGK